MASASTMVSAARDMEASDDATVAHSFAGASLVRKSSTFIGQKWADFGHRRWRPS